MIEFEQGEEITVVVCAQRLVQQPDSARSVSWVSPVLSLRRREQFSPKAAWVNVCPSGDQTRNGLTLSS
ncbi:MAG TPA: hypothetical protein VF982_07820, partial [Anaerolineales bacterium]